MPALTGLLSLPRTGPSTGALRRHPGTRSTSALASLALAILVSFTLAALFATSAMAGGGNPTGPEYGRCVPAPPGTGAFQNPNCTIPAPSSSGSWTFEPASTGAPTATFSVTISQTTFTSQAGTAECGGGFGSGTITGPKTGEERFTFTSCHLAGTSTPCTGVNDSFAGNITSADVTVELGWIDQSKGEVGLLLYAAPGVNLSESNCGNVQGSIIGLTSGLRDTMGTAGLTTYRVSSLSQVPENFEGGPKNTLEQEVFGFKIPLTEISSATTKLSRAIEVNTVESTSPVAGSVEGTVTDQNSAPISGAVVSLCERHTATCYTEQTDGAGHYSASGVVDGEYVGTVSPPGNNYRDGATQSLVVSGTSSTTQNFTLFSLTSPSPPPGTTVSGVGQTTVSGEPVPVVFWEFETPITTKGCVGGTATAFITALNTYTLQTETIGPLGLSEFVLGSGEFEGRVPRLRPLHGEAAITISVSHCPQASEEDTIEFPIYIDPSGTVVDGNNSDAPVSGATVTLLSAPTLSGPYTPVPNGSDVMSQANRVNPDTSRSDGSFGWDTVAGFYEVEASKRACGSTRTEPFEVPPPQTDLKLVLHCVAISPAFTIEKLQKLEGEPSYTEGELSGEVGQTVDYQVLVKNTGNVELTFTPLNDPGCENIAPAGTQQVAPGATQTYTCKHKGLAVGTYTNTASIEGNEGAGNHTSNEVKATVIKKATFEIKKLQKLEGGSSYTEDEVTGEVDQTVDYQVLVKNTGNVELTLMALQDSRCESISPAGSQQVAPGATQTYTCEYKGLAVGTYTNTASIEGNEGAGSHTSNEVKATVIKKATFEIAKLQKLEGGSSYTEDELTGEVGQTVDYQVLVKNTGNVELTLMPLQDAGCENISPAGSQHVHPGATQTYTCEHKGLAVGTYTNTASIEGNEGAGTHTSNEVKATVIKKATFEIAKLQKLEGEPSYTEGELTGKIGQTVDYQVLVKNTGNVELTFTPLNDPGCENISPAGTQQVAPGATQTYTCKHKGLAVGTYTNTASIEGNEGAGNHTSNSVKVKVPPEPHWYAGGAKLAEGSTDTVTSKGAITLQLSGSVGIKCKTTDKETIENPIGGGAGVDSLTELALSSCKQSPKASACAKGETLTVAPLGLPWSSRLLAGPPIRDRVNAVEIAISCTKGTYDLLKGSLTPVVGGTSALEFGAGSGELTESRGSGKATVAGTEKLKGPKHAVAITASAP
jgi:uncharacterized repeat protein (TIGR01451 family)